jgi:hypothetical protein
MDYAKFLIDDTYNVDYVIYRFKNKVRRTFIILSVKQWDSIYDVQLILYGSKKNGNLKRNIINNNNKNKLGFMKNGSIWSLTSPTERRTY